jgi:hypothetical protein
MPTLLANSGASLKIVTNGLTAHLDASSIFNNSWVDISGKGLSANIYGSASYSPYNGGCVAFNGGYVQTPNMPLSGSSSNAWSMGIWVNPSTFSGNIVSMSSANPVGGWNMPPISSSGAKFLAKVWQGNSGTTNQLSSTVYTPGTWYYVVLVWDQINATQNLYVNGVLASTQSNVSYSASGVDNYLYLGQANPGADNTGTFYGYMGNFHYYSRALNQTEILQNYNALKSRYASGISNSVVIPTTGLQLFLDAQQAISNNGGANWLDISGNNNNVSWNVSPSFTPAGPNYWTFNGSSTYGTIPNIQFPSAQTLIMVLRTTYTSGRRNPWNQAYGGYGTWTHEQGQTMSQYFGNAGSNNSPYIGTSSATTPQNNSWFMLASTRGTSYQTWYLNGSQTGQTANPYGTLANDSNSILLGNGYAGYWQGDMAVVIAYNRELSSAEINQVYTTFKTRYGF